MVRSVQSKLFSKENRLIKIKQANKNDKATYVQLAEGMLVGYRRGKNKANWHGKISGKLIGDDSIKYKAIVLGLADDYVEADGHRVLSFSQAQAKLHQLKKDMCDRIYTSEQPSITFEQAADLYHADYLVRSVRPNAITLNYLQRSKLFEIPYRVANKLPNKILGKVRLNDITIEDLNSLKNAIANRQRHRPYSKKRNLSEPEKARMRKATANKLVTSIKAVLNFAFVNNRQTRLRSNKEFINFKSFPDTNKARVQWWDADECQRWLNHCNEPSLKMLFLGAISCGFRAGEQSLLRVKDVVLDGNTPHINIPAEICKSNKSRNVLIPEQYYDMYQTLVIGRNPDAFLFERLGGRNKRPNWFHNSYAAGFKKVTQAAGLPDMPWHCLRHSYASQLVNAGVMMKVVADQLGHSTTKYVELWYGHLNNQVILASINKLPVMHNITTDAAEVVRIRRLNKTSTGTKTAQPKSTRYHDRQQIWARPDNAEELLNYQSKEQFKVVEKARNRGETYRGSGWKHKQAAKEVG